MSGPVIYHGTPLTPRPALQAMAGRAFCVSFWRPDDAEVVEAISPDIMFDNGAFSEWRAALKRGEPWFVREDWSPYYRWLEGRLFQPGRWAVIPDAPGAPSQLNDGLLNDWPFGRSKGAPLWHMDGPLDRFLRLAERYDRVCIGWVGEGAPGCEAWFRRMDELARHIGNQWPVTHMMRGVLVAREYPFHSADATSLAQNGHRYDWIDKQHDPFADVGPFLGRRRYADRLEHGHFCAGVRSTLSGNRQRARQGEASSPVRSGVERPALQLGLL